MLARQLSKQGLVQCLADAFHTAWSNVPPLPAGMLLASVYVVSMYGFSSLTGHAMALAGPVLQAGKALHVPPYVMAAFVACLGCLAGCLTTYSSGPIVMYAGMGWVSRQRAWQIGAVVGMLHLTVFFTIGLGWWHLLGWW